jgi:hypothetical protein
MLLILIRPLSGTFLRPVCECSLFIAMQYRKLERARESPVLGIDNVTGTVRSTRPDFSGVLRRMSAEAVSFVTCIRWVSGSNLGLDREFPDFSLLWLSSVPPGTVPQIRHTIRFIIYTPSFK